jgi:tRNA 5-methylaminomethyl-2-thiouridine biosynthesis bifunctional protein
VKPGRLCDVLLSTPGVTVLAAQVAGLRRASGSAGWEALDGDGHVLASAPVVVLAAAAGVPGLLARSGLPTIADMGVIAGQISLLPAHALHDGGPRCVVSGEGYLLPAQDGWCVAGSTYVHDTLQAEVSADGHAANVARVQALAPGLMGSLDPASLSGWAGWRAVLPGRLPAIGRWPGAEGLWLATGYASRGLTWSALAGDVIAAALSGEPQPVAADLLAAVSPARLAVVQATV